MKAAILRGVGQALEIEDVDVSKPIGHEVLVRVAATGVCRSDLHMIEGLYPAPFPCVLGHESAGVVEAVGDQVGYVKPGDHVISCLSVFCGHCEACLTGHLVNCERPEDVNRAAGEAPRLSRNGELVHQFYNLSSFAETMLVHEHAIVRIREDMPLDRAALIGCGVTTGVGAVHNTAKIEVGSTVAVIGLGGVGLSAVNGAAISGAGRIIAIDSVGSKLNLARHFGATDVIDASAGDPVEAVREMSGRCDLSLVVGSDNSSNTRALVRTARVLGAPAHRVDSADAVRDEWLDGAEVVGVTAGASAPDNLVREVVERIRPSEGWELLRITEEDEYFPLPRRLRSFLTALGAALALGFTARPGAPGPLSQDRQATAARALSALSAPQP